MTEFMKAVLARSWRRASSLFPLLVVAACIAPTDGAPAAPINSQAHGVEHLGGGAAETSLVEARASAKRVEETAAILIVLDGARWQEIFGGADPAVGAPRGFDVSKLTSGPALMPNLHDLIEKRGVAIGADDHGEPIVASGPRYVSLPGYMEIFGGAPSSCTDNECARTDKPTIVDDLRAVSPSVGDVAIISSWPAIENAAAREPWKVVMSTGCKHGQNAGALRFDYSSSQLFWQSEEALPWPGENDYRPDMLTAQIALKYLAKKRPRLLFIGLGDMDEYAHKNDYRDYIMSLQYADKVIGDVVKTLDGMGERGRKTTIFVTADHGRADDFRTHGDSPESARVFLVAAGGDVPARGIVSPTKKHRLADIAPTMRTILGLPQRASEGAGEPIEEIVGP